MHYDPLTDGGTTCWMERYGNRWGERKAPIKPGVEEQIVIRLRDGTGSTELLPQRRLPLGRCLSSS